MQILSAASAFPRYLLLSRCMCRALEEYWGDKLESPALMRRLQRHTGVEGRFLTLPLQAYTKLATGEKPIVFGFKTRLNWASRPSAASQPGWSGAARSGGDLFHVRNGYLKSLD